MDLFPLLNSKEIIDVPIQDNGEVLIDLLGQDELSYGPSPEIPNNTDYTKMRLSVYKNLCLAQNMMPTGIKFRILRLTEVFHFSINFLKKEKTN